MKEAVEWAAKNGGATGEKRPRRDFILPYQKANWVPAGHGRRLQCLDVDREKEPSRLAQGSISIA